MGTRGVYGFRKYGIDKTSYNHFDSYPDCLGQIMLDFCQNTSIEEMNKMYDALTMVSENFTPTPEMIEQFRDTLEDPDKCGDMYWLLRSYQGELHKLKEDFQKGKRIYMTDSRNFITDSCFCEFGYIINLDTNNLEYWLGWQRVPDEDNRYGSRPDYGYYPCALTLEIPLDNIQDTQYWRDAMNDMDKTNHMFNQLLEKSGHLTEQEL